MAITYPIFSNKIEVDLRHPSSFFRRKARPVKLTLIRGVPGSGKSTFAKKYAIANGHIKIVEFDDFWIDKNKTYKFIPEIKMACVEYGRSAVTHELIIEKRPCIITGVFNKLEYIEYFKNLCEMFNIPLEVIKMTGNFQNIHNVPDDVLKTMKEEFEDFEGEILK